MKVVRVVAIMIFLMSIAYAGENHSISGEITFQYEADIYIGLYTQEAYQDMAKITPKPPYLQIIKMNPELYKAGKTTFEFVDIPKDTYGIIAFQETIKNKKFDVKLWYGTSDEPFGCYRQLPPTQGVPYWDMIKFDLNKNITGIKIEM